MPLKKSNVRKGLEIADRYVLDYNDDGVWKVPDTVGSRTFRRFRMSDPPSCTCPTYARSGDCKHLWAVFITVNRTFGEPSVLAELPIPVPEKPPVWQEEAEEPPKFEPVPFPTAKDRRLKPAAREAKADAEATRLHWRLLYEICRGVPEPEAGEKGGRPPLPFREMLFAVLLKGSRPLSGLDFKTELERAKDEGYISRVPHPNIILRYVRSRAVSEALRELVVVTSKAYRDLDRHFAIDSTKMYFGRLRAPFAGRTQRTTDPTYHPRKDHVKIHALVGLRSKIFATVRISRQYRHDGSYLPPLVRRARADGFVIESVAADSAYARESNFAFLDEIRARPYIEFRKDATGEKSGPHYKHWFEAAEADPVIHVRGLKRRRLIESTFKSMKDKVGREVKAKRLHAVWNETMCKVICHNVRWAVKNAYRHGIKPDFWPE